MNASAQNAMLKLLEEGPAYAAFLLLAENGGGGAPDGALPVRGALPHPRAPRGGGRVAEDPLPGPVRGGPAPGGPGGPGYSGPGGLPAGGGRRTGPGAPRPGGRPGPGLEGTDELALFEASLLLEKAPKEELPRLLDQLYLQLGERLAVSGGEIPPAEGGRPGAEAAGGGGAQRQPGPALRLAVRGNVPE